MSAPLVKICGLMREADVDGAVVAGADLVGFVCVADSPRGITVERALELAARVPAPVRTVAVSATSVFPAQPGEGFDLVQVYGRPDSMDDVIVGFRGEPDEMPDGVPLLLDLARGSDPSNDDLRAHWQRAAKVRAPVMLAGSLDAGNVAEAVRQVRPWAVDTARGVEVSPGVKDAGLIEQFVRRAKEALA
ncbi:MAG: phosphoribosylanthranilate isomerase [Gaiellales bacterium]|nr:phosphoribosylanthranilate isomerase [Gaiellales bacterium]